MASSPDSQPTLRTWSDRSMSGSFFSRCRAIRASVEAGMTTAEYAVGTLAACAFAAVLMAVVRSDAIKSALTGLIASALSIAT